MSEENSLILSIVQCNEIKQTTCYDLKKDIYLSE